MEKMQKVKGYQGVSPISKSIVCSSFFPIIPGEVSVVFYYLKSFVAFYNIFVHYFIFLSF